MWTTQSNACNAASNFNRSQIGNISVVYKMETTQNSMHAQPSPTWGHLNSKGSAQFVPALETRKRNNLFSCTQNVYNSHLRQFLHQLLVGGDDAFHFRKDFLLGSVVYCLSLHLSRLLRLVLVLFHPNQLIVRFPLFLPAPQATGGFPAGLPFLGLSCR